LAVRAKAELFVYVDGEEIRKSSDEENETARLFNEFEKFR